jgi:DNA-binding NtrC family response regulator
VQAASGWIQISYTLSKGELSPMQQARILLCDFLPAAKLAGSLRVILESSPGPGMDVRHETVELRRAAFGPADLSRIIEHFDPDLAFFVLSRDLFRRAKALFETLRRGPFTMPAIVVIDGVEPTEMLEFLKVGATDFVTAPLKSVEILPRVWRLMEQKRRSSEAQRADDDEGELKSFIGRNAAFVAEIHKIPLVARCDTGVLIFGETGTGKELVARAIHSLSPRASKPFIPVNCGAIPEDLAESELFGHERGAFTGAIVSRVGMIEAAEGGTVFLDEVACLPLLAQAKLLRFLQEKEYRPLGGAKVKKSNVRVIAATNIDLEKAVSHGKFRQDLYYRVDVIRFWLPPLRERREDIPVLARHFLDRCAGRFGRPAHELSAQALARLIAYDWPGNIRELEHTMERIVVLCDRDVVEADDLRLPNALNTEAEESFQTAKAHVIAEFEKGRIQNLLLAYQGNISRAAQAAHKNRRAFWGLIRKYGIEAEQFRPAGPLEAG